MPVELGERVEAVLDASFWINAERSGTVGYLPEYFMLKTPPRVAEEITASPGRPTLPASALLFQEWRASGLVEVEAPTQSYTRFDAGENEAIALAAEHGWWLLIDNSAPRDFSRGPLRLTVLDSPAWCVFLYDRGHVSYAQALDALRRTQAAQRVVREAVILLAATARRKGALP